MKGHMKFGTYTGDGAVKNIELGFVPNFVILANITDGTPMAFWWLGMTADTALDVAAAVASNANNAVSSYDGAAGSVGKGFSVGTDYSVSAKVYRYAAFGDL